ncbi:TBC1 domain family member 1 isoform X2 [Esox lucius]|uniref:TBC1 domain family member 4 n=1 Tax=Esox lucius TaxID=8010 RepID=A0A6Q2YNF5_ESOLU|nr:TBC1 domain family member 1 isoform X2 [Esox lucius]
MEGLYFEVKPSAPPSSPFHLTPKRSSSASSLLNLAPNRRSFTSSPLLTPPGRKQAPSEDEEEEVQYTLTLIGCLPVHPLTTMAMLPWVVSEIERPRPGERLISPGRHPGNGGGLPEGERVSIRDKVVRLSVSSSWVRCVWTEEEEEGSSRPWDPLTHTHVRQHVLFECRPHRIAKLLHNSREPCSFGCLVRDRNLCRCYSFHCHNRTKVPEIISALRQAGKSSARNDDLTDPLQAASSSEDCTSSSSTNSSSSSVSTTNASVSAVCTSTMFAKRFEVLFCGRVTVAHKKAPPALIDECIEKFSQSRGTEGGAKPVSSGGFVSGLRRALTFPLALNGKPGDEEQDAVREGGQDRGREWAPAGERPMFFKRDPSFPCLEALDENGLSPELHTPPGDPRAAGVQPASLQENRTMLFMVGRSQIFLVSPDTKKVSIEKSFREISFCSQGIRHVDHFGFICRETVEGGSCTFICYVFQCTDEALVDEIMLTLKQAFSVAALLQSERTQSQQCDGCPMQQLHRLCERIEGLLPSKAKLDLQRHLSTLDNQEQAAIFEITMRARPKSDQEENELVMASLRSLYEDKQKTHQHTHSTNNTQVPEGFPPVEVQSSSSKLEQFRTRAKRSLAASLEGIWKGSNRGRPQMENSEGDSNSSNSTLNSTGQDLSLEEPLPSCSLHSSPLPPSSSLRSHNSTGDLKRVGTSPLLPPSAVSLSSSCGETDSQSFRRRANTFSHTPSPSSADHTPSQRLHHSPQDSSSSTKPKLVRHYSVSTGTPHQSNDVAALSSPVAECVGDSPLRSRRHSWRQQIFLRVATPQKTDRDERGDSSLEGRVLSLSQGGAVGGGDRPLGVVPEERKRRGQADLRELWRKAILQQILLLRMERENNKIQASESKRLRLDYEEITPCLKDVTLVWEGMLGTPARSTVKFNRDTIHTAVGQGVPRQFRGEVWKFLSEQYLLSQTVPSRTPANNTPYKELLKQLTSQQHAILIDLGRTFPTHPYFQAQLGAGQLSLYNLLKAYSLLDPEVGYCQGLSFIAGVLLLHMGEEEAFNMLKFLMYDMGLRKQYRPDMIILQIQMYQLSRLLHDYHRDLYVHLEQQEIGPSLYAAPWFLTAFASHFPLGFVARVFDMLFLQGAEVIFKVSLSLLGSHKPLILQHDSLETIVDFIKTTLPNLGLVQMEKTINQVCEMDISKQLQAYEVEYHVLQDELCDMPAHLNQSQRAAQLERTNQSLRQQNLDLLEELQVSQARVCGLEGRVEGLVQSERFLKEQVCELENERDNLQSTVARLNTLLAAMGTRAPNEDLSPALDTHSVSEGEGAGVPDGVGQKTGELPLREAPVPWAMAPPPPLTLPE